MRGVGRISAVLVALSGFSWSGNALGDGPEAARGYWQMIPDEKRIELRHNGELITAYHVGSELTKPVFHPLIGPGGVAMTRSFPMENGPAEEERDHPFHRSLWFAHSDVNGVDFWREGENCGRQRHTGLRSVRIEPASITLQTTNDWLAPDDSVVLQDKRTYRWAKTRQGSVLVDISITLMAVNGVVRFGDVEEAGLSLRLAHWLRLEKKAGGTVPPFSSAVNSEGVKGRSLWGRRADWVDYSGRDPNGRITGLAVMDHPANLRHPTWWHARHYGLVAANPFGQGSFEKQSPVGAGVFVLEDETEVVLRWLVVAHPGNPESAAIAEMYRSFSRLQN